MSKRSLLLNTYRACTQSVLTLSQSRSTFSRILVLVDRADRKLQRFRTDLTFFFFFPHLSLLYWHILSFRPARSRQVVSIGTMERSLRLITYMVPSHPVELYECIAHFLEEELNVRVMLAYESRDPIALFENRPDPFVAHEADIGEFLFIFDGYWNSIIRSTPNDYV